MAFQNRFFFDLFLQVSFTAQKCVYRALCKKELIILHLKGKDIENPLSLASLRLDSLIPFVKMLVTFFLILE